MDYGFQRHYVQRAYTVVLLMRHCTNVLVAIVALADPASTAKPPGKWLVAALGCWAVYRLATRSHGSVFTAVDFAFTLAICAAIPLLTDSELVLYWSAPEAIAATAIVSFAASLPVRASLPMTALIVVTYAASAASVVGWASTLAMVSLRYFVIQAAISAVVRVALLRAAATIDRAHDGRRQADELRRRVAEAVRRYEWEQFALLHDTAASTLLMVGKGTPIPPDRLAAQARRDLAALNSRPSTPTRRIELIAALRERASAIHTSVRFHGMPALLLEGELGTAVVAAAAEAMRNVDRHAGATAISVEVSEHSVVVSDNGSGFIPTPSTTGSGIAGSIVGRMQRVGATANIHSVPGRGTAVELSWADTAQCGRMRESGTDSDHLIERVRIGYGYTMVFLALLILVLTVPFTPAYNVYPALQIGLAVLAALSCLIALPTLDTTHSRVRWLAVAALIVVTVVQSALLPASLLGNAAQWSLFTVGWCLSSLLLGLPLRTAIAILSANWIAACAVTLAREPSARILVSLGFLGAYLVVMQAFALVANAMIMHAASAAHAETQARLDLLARQRVADALQAEYRRRYADLRRSVIPLLTKLSCGGPVDAGLQQQARAESQRIRTMLDRASAFDHPLLHALRPAVDAATNRNVEVDVQVHSKLPHLGQADIEQLTEPISHLLDKCTVGARLVLTSTSKELIASVVGRGHTPEPHDEEPTAGIGTHEVVTLNSTTWLTIRHPLPTAGSDDTLTYDHAV